MKTYFYNTKPVTIFKLKTTGMFSGNHPTVPGAFFSGGAFGYFHSSTTWLMKILYNGMGDPLFGEVAI